MADKAVVTSGQGTITVNGDDVVVILKTITFNLDYHYRLELYDGSVLLNSTNGYGDRIRQFLERI